MSKTNRARADTLYTIDEDGAPVAQAEAVSRSEAVALWEASKRRPAVSARLATARESRDLAHLPLLTRGAKPDRDPRVGDLFDAGPADPVLVVTYCPPVDLPVKTYPPEVLAQIVADLEPNHMEDVRAMVPPQHAPIAAVADGLASGEPVAVDCAHSADLPADASRASAEAPVQERRRLFPDPPKGAGKAEAKYRNPETGESWSGRGLKPKWLVMAIEAGKALEDFLIDAPKERPCSD